MELLTQGMWRQTIPLELLTGDVETDNTTGTANTGDVETDNVTGAG